MIKNGVSYLIVFCITINVYSQQLSQYSNFVSNAFYYNPAVVGGHNCLVLKGGQRNQWIGFEGAPKTSFVSVSTSINNAKNFQPGTYIGLGGYLQTETFGAFRRSTVNLAYAYSTPLKGKTSIAYGLYLGFQELVIDGSLMSLQIGNDPIISGSSRKLLIPDIGAGLFLENTNWYIGYSAKQIAMNNWSGLIESELSKNRFHHFIMGGKRIKAEGFNLVPNTLLKYTNNSPAAIDLNLNLETFNNIFNLGISWRNLDAIIALLHLNIVDHLNIYYAFDFSTSKINTSNSNTHELIIGYKSCPKTTNKEPSCPLFY